MEKEKRFPLSTTRLHYGEAEDVIDKIQTSVHMGKYQYQDCAILYRTNAQSRSI